jgi:hypothetical protein
MRILVTSEDFAKATMPTKLQRCKELIAYGFPTDEG